MRIKMTPAMLVGSLALAAGPAMAGFYDCEFDYNKTRSGSAPAHVMVGTLSTGHVVALDSITYHTNNEHAVAARISNDSAKAITYRWQTPQWRNEQGQYTQGIRLRVHIQKATGEATVFAEPIGYANKETRAGQCKKVKPPQ